MWDNFPANKVGNIYLNRLGKGATNRNINTAVQWRGTIKRRSATEPNLHRKDVTERKTFQHKQCQLHAVWEEEPGQRWEAKTPWADWREGILGSSRNESREAVRRAAGLRSFLHQIIWEMGSGALWLHCVVYHYQTGGCTSGSTRYSSFLASLKPQRNRSQCGSSLGQTSKPCICGSLAWPQAGVKD